MVGGGAAFAVFGVALALHGVSDDGQPHSARAHDGRLFLLAVVVAALVVALVARRLARVEVDGRRRATRALFAVVGIACVAGVVVVALNSGGATSASAAGAHCTQGAARFGCGSSDERLDWWGQAWAMFERRPIGGTGAASFELAHRLRRAEFVRPTTEPHDFALQSLGETGIVGFALFARRRRPRGDRRAPPARGPRRARARGLPARVSREHPHRHRLGLRRRQRARVPLARRAARRAGDDRGATRVDLGARRARARRDGVPLARRAGRRPAQGRRGDRDREPGRRGAGALVESARRRPAPHGGGARGLRRTPAEGAAAVPAGDRHAAREPAGVGPARRSSSSTLCGDPCGAYRSLSRAYALDRYNRAVAFDGGPLDVARARARKRGCA